MSANSRKNSSEPKKENANPGSKPCKRYLVYWHKGMNSGLWGFGEEETAKGIANDLAEQENVYDVTIVDVKEGRAKLIKGKKGKGVF